MAIRDSRKQSYHGKPMVVCVGSGAKVGAEQTSNLFINNQVVRSHNGASLSRVLVSQ